MQGKANPGRRGECERVVMMLGLKLPQDPKARGRVERRVGALLNLVRLAVLAESGLGRR